MGRDSSQRNGGVKIFSWGNYKKLGAVSASSLSAERKIGSRLFPSPFRSPRTAIRSTGAHPAARAGFVARGNISATICPRPCLSTDTHFIGLPHPSLYGNNAPGAVIRCSAVEPPESTLCGNSRDKNHRPANRKIWLDCGSPASKLARTWRKFRVAQSTIKTKKDITSMHSPRGETALHGSRGCH